MNMVGHAPLTNAFLKICTAATSVLYSTVKGSLHHKMLTLDLHGIRSMIMHFHCQKTNPMHTINPTTKVAMTFAEFHG